MKRLLFTFFLLLSISSCNGNFSIVDLGTKSDLKIAKVTSFSLDNNTTFTLSFDETVELIDIEIDDEKIDASLIGSIFTIHLPSPIKRGRSAVLSVTARKPNGNITRASFRLIGKNLEIPTLMINELSIAGTKSSPDRIELLVLEDGNLAGMVITDKLKDEFEHQYILPEIDVKYGDLVVIYWNAHKQKDVEELQNKKKCYYLDAGIKTTLSSTKGTVILYSEKDGEIQDAVIYNNDFSETYYGNEELEKTAQVLSEENQWNGAAMDSRGVTSSRVFARLPSGFDSDSADDWFITKARCSTFGRYNIYDPYIEE